MFLAFYGKKEGVFLVYSIITSDKRMQVLLSFLRDCCAGIMLITTIIPETSSRILFSILLISWFTLAFLSCPYVFLHALKEPDLAEFSIIIWIFLYIFFYYIGYASGFDIYLVTYIRFTIGMIFFSFYSSLSNCEAIRRLAIISVLCFTYTCLTTLIGLEQNPWAARFLSTGIEDITDSLVGLNIGGYGFVYSLSYVVVVMFGVVRQKKLRNIYKYLAIGFILLGMYTLYKASFMIAILLTIISMLLILLHIKRPLQIVIISVVILLLWLIFIPVVIDSLLYLAMLDEGGILAEKLLGMAATLQKGVQIDVDPNSRSYLYSLSLKTFLSSPFIGIGGSYGETGSYEVGKHSEYLDTLAMYGVFGFLFLFFLLFTNAKKVYIFLQSDYDRYVFLCYIFMFVLLGVFNTFLTSPLLGLTVYFIAPSILMLGEVDHDESNVDYKHSNW